MGAVVLLTPVVIAAWPAFASAIASAAAALGYAKTDGLLSDELEAAGRKITTIDLEVPNSEIITGQLGRAEKIIVIRDDVMIAFRRDERGKASLTVLGKGKSHDELRAVGAEMSQRVVRDYVYQQIINEVRSRDYIVVEESVDDNNAIHMTVRHWEN